MFDYFLIDLHQIYSPWDDLWTSIFAGVSFCDFGFLIDNFVVNLVFLSFSSFAYFRIFWFGEIIDCLGLRSDSGEFSVVSISGIG